MVPIWGRAAIQPAALPRLADGLGLGHAQYSDGQGSAAQAGSLGHAGQMAGEQFGREQAGIWIGQA